MHFLLVTVILLALVSGAAAQCRDIPTRNCRQLRNNGFCTNQRISLATRRRTCGVTCGLCNRLFAPLSPPTDDGSAELLPQETQIAARGGRGRARCVDANANCASFAATRNFCTRPDISIRRKLEVCCATCRPIILATRSTTTTTTEAPTTSEAIPPTPFPLTTGTVDTTQSISSSTIS